MHQKVGDLIRGGPDDNLQNARRCLGWGRSHCEMKDYDAAIADYTSATRLEPKHDDVYYARGNAYARIDEVDLAIEDFNKFIELNPDSAHAYAQRGACYARKGKQRRAIEDFNKATQLCTEYPLVYASRGMAYFRIGEYLQAIQDLGRAIELHPSEWAALYNDRGRAYFRNENYCQAIQDFNKAIELVPDCGAAYSNRGFCHDLNDDLDPALEDYNKAIELRHRWDVAFEDVDGDAWRPIDIDDTVAAAFYRRGTINFKKGKYDQAIRDFSEAICINPAGAPAYSEFGRERRASPDMTADAAAHFMRGRAYAEIDESDLAIADYTEAIRLSPNYADALYERGKVHVRQAIADCTDAIRRNPDNEDAGVIRAVLDELQGIDY